MEQQAEQAERSFTPPYNIPFRTFLNLLQRMEVEGGTPPRIDRSYLRSLSGQAQTYLMGALRSFGLIEDNGEVAPALEDLVLKPQDRPRLIGEILRRFYESAVTHGEINGTPKQLEEIFSEFNLSGDTLRKAMTFYLHAAEYAGLPISRYVKVRKTAPRRAPGPRRTVAKGKSEFPTAPTPPAVAEPITDLRKEYIQKLMERALTAEGKADAELLDRIERLLGYSGETEPTTNGQEE